MILHPSIIALMAGSGIAVFMLLYSSWFGSGIIRRWDLRSGSESQLRLEKRTYLISAVMTYVFGFQLLSLFLFIFTADSLFSLFVGAMCAAGTLNVNSYGYPVFILKLFNFILAGIWLIVNYTDNRAHDYPLIRQKYLLLLFICPFIVSEAALQGLYFLNLEADVITSCCGSLFSKEGRDSLELFSNVPRKPLSILFYLSIASTFGAGFLLWMKKMGAYMFSALSLATFIVSAFYLIHVVVLYIYELPTHHCPFCIFKSEYSYVGYMLYLTLFAGVIPGIGTGVLQLFSAKESLKGIVPHIQRSLLAISLCSYGGFLVIAIYKILTSTLRM